MFLWVALAFFLTGGLCDAKSCDQEEFFGFTACYAIRGYGMDVSSQGHNTVWNRNVAKDYCRSGNSQKFSSCVRNVLSSCTYPFQPQPHPSVPEALAIAIGGICSNIDDVFKAIEYSACLFANYSEVMTQCIIDTANRQFVKVRAKVMAGETFTAEKVKSKFRRYTLDTMSCMEGVLINRCNLKMADLFRIYEIYQETRDEL